MNHSYPQTPGYRDLDTSFEAAQAIAPCAKVLREKVYQAICARNMTADECADELGESILAIRPRVTENVKLGLIEDTGLRRKNRSGRNAKVWAAVKGQIELFV